MKKFNPNKNIIITLVIVIVAIAVISLSAAKRDNDGNANAVQGTVNDTLGLVDKVLQAPVKLVGNAFGAIGDLFDTYEENQRLKSALDEYDMIVQVNDDYKRQLADLQEDLDMNKTLESYEKIVTSVISRSPDSWQELLVVDSGAKDGVEVNMAVMAKNGLIGRVIEVSEHTSKIELLTSDNKAANHFPVKITSKTGVSYALLEEYDEATGLFLVTQITGDFEIEAEDLVQTSGLGGNSPAGLIVGEVVSVQTDKLGMKRQAYVQASADMYDFSAVTIIKRTVGEE
ncbi:rod shape-determining protein MreC [Enterococcus sp. PF1-24]|uniref:rod shape-determining protein MreC n=1 Tax=unclassified Enterococcus TaxID=2608891 RepID=UPI0024756076|nr:MULTISPECIES: rod shape-determining protein MreC [unclassified Enterococcus]MDH6364261.1 rod shape-determining protein MreC [Enterococcus sp. PFB1-1]MDH6401380.1 rod shape-determining protein MreC [Enterococcus sp. PF1-24]